MICVAELGELREVDAAMRKKGGRLLAVSVDEPHHSLEVVASLKLPFAILSDSRREVTRAYGLLHEGASPEGADIAIPAHLLLDRSGTIRWRYVARKSHDRPHPDEDLAAISALE